MAFEMKGYKKQYDTGKTTAYKPKRGRIVPLMTEDQKETGVKGKAYGEENLPWSKSAKDFLAHFHKES